MRFKVFVLQPLCEKRIAYEIITATEMLGFFSLIRLK